MKKQRRSKERMREIILRILMGVEDCDFVKLCHLLYLCDFMAYKNLGSSLTGFSYYKKGKCFYPFGLKSLLAEMVLNKEIKIIKSSR